MAFVVNPRKKFVDSGKKTIRKKGIPGNVRDAFFIANVKSDGIFQIESGKGLKMYDRVYVFTDINYVNKDVNEKRSILEQLAAFLGFMNADFKITVANEYRNMSDFIRKVYSEMNRDAYPEISAGMKEWIRQKMKDGEVQDLERVLYLTVTVKAYSHEEARSYFLGIDMELEHMFLAMRSVLVPLNGEMRLSALKKFFYRDTDNFSFDFDTPYTDPLDTAIPISIDACEMDFMVFNGHQYASVLFGRNFNSSINEEKLIHELTRVDYPSIVTIDYAPVDRSVLKDYLRYLHTSAERAISQELDEKNKNGQTMSGISYMREKNMEEIEGVSDQIDDNDDSCLLVGLLVVITAESENELSKRIDSMKHAGKENGVILETYNWVQLKAFNTALPYGGRQVSHQRAFLTSSLVAMQPFYAQDLVETGGQMYGMNRTTKHLVFGNRKKLASPHGMIVGHTGSGKSMILKLLIAQVLLCIPDDITVLDPQNEYQSICYDFGGQFIDFTPKSECHINPMEIPAEIWKTKDMVRRNQFIADVTKWANAFCQSIMRNMVFTQEHAAVIGECVREIYEEAFSRHVVKKQPTIRDLRQKLGILSEQREHEQDRILIRRIFNSLAEYTEGAYDMFAYPSNVDINNRFVAFGLHNVPEDFWEPVMITIMSFLSTRMEYNQKARKATRFIVDEAQTVANNESSAAIMLKAILTYRKYGGICTLALQNLTRALENPQLRDMFSNCGFKLFLDQGGVDAKRLTEIQELSEREFQSLGEETPGYGLMVWGKKIILLDSQIAKENVLYQKFSTNFHEKVSDSQDTYYEQVYIEETPELDADGIAVTTPLKSR